MKTQVFENPINGKPENIEYVLNLINRLKRLLDDPHPNSLSWVVMYSEFMQKISDYWNSDEPSEDNQDDLG